MGAKANAHVDSDSTKTAERNTEDMMTFHRAGVWHKIGETKSSAYLYAMMILLQ